MHRSMQVEKNIETQNLLARVQELENENATLWQISLARKAKIEELEEALGIYECDDEPVNPDTVERGGSDDDDAKFEILQSVKAALCHAHFAQLYTLPDGTDVDHAGLSAWLLERGIDINDEDSDNYWEHWLDCI